MTRILVAASVLGVFVVFFTANPWLTRTAEAQEGTEAVGPFVRGDCNGDGDMAGAVSDAVFLLNYLFLEGMQPTCLAACDVNGDGQLSGSVTDAVYLLNYNFLLGPLPPEPFPECGFGTVADGLLGCQSPPATCLRQDNLVGVRQRRWRSLPPQQ